MSKQLETAIFGGGCFWCVEAVFQRMQGVEKVVSGYSGGSNANPTYKEICTGMTGHAEVVEITYDPEVASFRDLLDVFFQTHDPTTLNRQGNDTGTQYRSVVFYQNEQQKQETEEFIGQLTKAKAFRDPIVTEVSPLDIFYPGEGYHQNYFNDNPGQPYCAYVVKPKVDKFQKLFKDKMKAGV